VRLLLLAALLLVIAIPSATATTQPDMIVGVNVGLKAHAVTLFPKQVARGRYVQFKVRNTTAKRTLFTLAGRTIAVPARKLRYLAINFGVRGKYRYVSRPAPGVAIRGTFVVT
jgi:hypothetical protein